LAETGICRIRNKNLAEPEFFHASDFPPIMDHGHKTGIVIQPPQSESLAGALTKFQHFKNMFLADI